MERKIAANEVALGMETDIMHAMHAMKMQVVKPHAMDLAEENDGFRSLAEYMD
jgi:hypothetical protein